MLIKKKVNYILFGFSKICKEIENPKNVVIGTFCTLASFNFAHI